MHTTLLLAFVMMAGLFLMLWSAVGFIQDTKYFTSAPREVQKALQPKKERFRGQRVLGWCLLICSLALMVAALVLAGLHGVRHDYTYSQFLVRFLIMLLGVKVFDILVFDWVLLCHSQFYPHYFPEVKEVVGPQLFGYNWKSHLAEALGLVAASALLAYLCTLL